MRNGFNVGLVKGAMVPAYRSGANNLRGREVQQMPPETVQLHDLLAEIRSCRQCEPQLPLGANPVVRASCTAKMLIVGQAPGTRVHATGIPWNDPSGERLRDWLDLEKSVFYDESRIGIVPMGFCYPGKGKSGDLPPRAECAPLWHERLIEQMPEVELVLLVGSYAQGHYLGNSRETLTERVRRWRDFGPRYLPMPHPSPRNNLWLRRNAWFESEILPELRRRVRRLVLQD